MALFAIVSIPDTFLGVGTVGALPRAPACVPLGEPTQAWAGLLVLAWWVRGRGLSFKKRKKKGRKRLSGKLETGQALFEVHKGIILASVSREGDS